MARTLLPRPRKRIWSTILAVIFDAAIAAGILWSIYYFNYLVPYKFEASSITFPDRLAGDIAAQDQFPHAMGQIVSAGNTILETAGLQPQKEQPAMVLEGAGTLHVCDDLGGKFADKFSDAVISTDNSYQSQDFSITVTPYHTGSGDNKISYYVADIYTSNLNCFRTYFAQDTYGSGYKEHITDMSRDVRAALAVNGDSYCYNRKHTAGVLIRNGMLYRAEPTTSDVCILYQNGEMKTYSPSQFDPQQAIRDGAYQSWTFGPNLLDEHGKVPETFNTWGYIRKAHPRTAIGYYEPGHYCLVVVDGRQKGYSRGMTLPELAQVFEGLGCSAAYNLDGGHSSFMALGEQVINCPYRPDHKIVDCLYFGEG